MEDNKKFLTYDVFKTYHNKFVEQLRDLTFEPKQMFESKRDLFTLSNWTADEYGRVFGLKEGLIITVGGEIWQLVKPDVFQDTLRRIQDVEQKVLIDVNNLGWKVVGSTTEFDIENHTLKLMK